MINKVKFNFDRNIGLGGSDTAAVFNFSNYKSAIDLYLEKTNQLIQENENNSWVMERGNILEPLIIKLFERDYNCQVDVNINTIFSKKYPHLYANLDGVITQEKAVVECKINCCSSNLHFGEHMTDEIPYNYRVQVIQYMMLAELEKAYIVVLQSSNNMLDFLAKRVQKNGIDLSLCDDANIKLKCFIVNRNKEIEDIIIKKTTEFWNNYIVKKISPTDDFIKSCKDIEKMFPAIQDSIVTADEEIKHLLKLMHDKQQDIKLNEEQYEKYKLQLCKKIKQAEIIVDENGKKLCSWKTSVKKTLDSKALKEFLKEKINDFYKSSSNRIFRLI